MKSRFPKVEIRDLTPILDELRSVKSPREIDLIRRASQLAGWGLIAAIKNTRPGAYEYQLEAVARYVFQVNGARLEGYRSITAGGTDNIWNMHYYRNADQLKSGDLVLMDFAPEFHYYTSDIAHVAGNGYLYSLKVEAQIIRELTRSPDTLCSQSRQDRVWVSGLLLCADPLLDGPCGVANVVHCVAKFAENSRVEIARYYSFFQSL